jgi:hypothetical protein
MSYGVRVVDGAAKNFNEYISILQLQLVSLGLEPKQEIATEGNYFKIKGGFGCTARVYYKSIGNDVIVTPEVTRSTIGTILPVFLLCLLLIPGIVMWIWTSRNIRKTAGKVLNALESSIAAYKAQFRRAA